MLIIAMESELGGKHLRAMGPQYLSLSGLVLALEGFQWATRYIVSFLFIQEGFGVSVCIELARNKAGMYQLYNCMVGFF